jgi:3'-phosphoadenosine 5'-phosphosulfate sulfotransferase (PAPS reductase)/FAD synthetase
MRNEIAALRARTRIYQGRLANARRIVARAITTSQSGYIALSGGKDSTVVMDLVHSQAPDVPCVFSDDEWNFPETLDYIGRMRCARIAATIKHAEWFTSWANGADDIPEGTIWVDAPKNNGLQTYAKEKGYDLVYLGLRQEENNIRRMHLRVNGPLFLAQKDQTWHCNPIHDWIWQDVWAYIVSNNLDYNRAYDRLEEMGVEPQYQRIGPFAVERVLGYGQMAILKRGWPELFNYFAAEHPKAREYV